MYVSVFILLQSDRFCPLVPSVYLYFLFVMQDPEFRFLYKIFFKEDYRRAILDMDEKQFINIRLVLTEMRNHFATLHDMITKNLEKIKTPRSNNAEHMYWLSYLMKSVFSFIVFLLHFNGKSCRASQNVDSWKLCSFSIFLDFGGNLDNLTF